MKDILIAKIIPQPKKNDVLFVDAFAKNNSISNDLIFFKKNIRERLEVPIRKYKGPNWSKILNKQKRGKKIFFSTYKINYQNFILLAPIMDFLFK